MLSALLEGLSRPRFLGVARLVGALALFRFPSEVLGFVGGGVGPGDVPLYPSYSSSLGSHLTLLAFLGVGLLVLSSPCEVVSHGRGGSVKTVDEDTKGNKGNRLTTATLSKEPSLIGRCMVGLRSVFITSFCVCVHAVGKV